MIIKNIYRKRVIKTRLEDSASNLVFFNNGNVYTTTKSGKGVKCACSAAPLTAFLSDFLVVDSR